MSAKRSRSGAQLSLGIQPDEQSASVVCRGIFSLNYLKQHFAKAGDFPSLDEVRPIYEKVKIAGWKNTPDCAHGKKPTHARNFLIRC